MKIGYSATFNLPNCKQPYEKIWIEENELLHGLNLLDISDEEIKKLTQNIRRIQYAIKKQVIDFHYESNKAAEKSEIQISHTDKISDVISDIYNCSTVKELEEFSLISKNNLVVKQAYTKKLNELENAAK